MKNQIYMTPKQRSFIKYNSLDNPSCIRHIENVMITNDVKEWEIKEFKNGLGLYLRFGDYQYILCLNGETAELDLYYMNRLNSKIMLISQPGQWKFDSSWYECVQMLNKFEGK